MLIDRRRKSEPKIDVLGISRLPPENGFRPRKVTGSSDAEQNKTMPGIVKGGTSSLKASQQAAAIPVDFGRVW